MSDIFAGLEALDFSYAGGRHVGSFSPVLVGVVGSGNLEVLLESTADLDCSVRIETSARGFSPIWQAVADDFFARHPIAGVRVSINDMGATPAIVCLRLDQAVAELPGSLT